MYLLARGAPRSLSTITNSVLSTIRKSHQGDKSELISREANFNADRCDEYLRGIVVQWRTIPRIAP